MKSTAVRKPKQLPADQLVEIGVIKVALERLLTRNATPTDCMESILSNEHAAAISQALTSIEERFPRTP
jgi:hypothetical protein